MKNWTKFGTSIKLLDETFKIKVNPSSNNFTKNQISGKQCSGVERKRRNGKNKETSSESVPRYGAYYLHPNTWSRTEVCVKPVLKAVNKTRQDGLTKNITTRSFETFLKSSKQYEKTDTLIEILQ